MAYLAFDVETTGLTPGYHEILQLGAILLDDNFIEYGSGYVCFEPKHWERAEKRALEINGIDPKTWKPTYSTTKESLTKMTDFIYKHVSLSEQINLLGHNMDKFDEPMLRALYKEEGMSWIFHYHGIDTMQFYKLWCLVTETKIVSLRLIDCCEKFNIEISKAHNAMADIRVTVGLVRAIRDDLMFRIKHGQKGLV